MTTIRKSTYLVSRNTQYAMYKKQYEEAAKQVSDNFESLDTASVHGQYWNPMQWGGKGDGKIGKWDLQAVVENESLPKALRDACQFLLDNPDAYEKFATAGDDAGGTISKEDVAAPLPELTYGEELEQIHKQLSYERQWSNVLTQLSDPDNFRTLDVGNIGTSTPVKIFPDNKISRQDIENVLKNKNLSEDLREACEFLRDTPGAFERLAAAFGKGDNRFIEPDDLPAMRKELASIPAALDYTPPSEEVRLDAEALVEQLDSDGMKELLNKDIKDLKPHELEAVTLLLERTTTIDEEGSANTDFEALQELLHMGYDGESDNGMTPVMDIALRSYMGRVNGQLSKEGHLLTDDSLQGTEKAQASFLEQEMLKRDIIGTYLNYEKDHGKRSLSSNSPSFELTALETEGHYNLKIDGENFTVHSFNAKRQITDNLAAELVPLENGKYDWENADWNEIQALLHKENPEDWEVAALAQLWQSMSVSTDLDAMQTFLQSGYYNAEVYGPWTQPRPKEADQHYCVTEFKLSPTMTNILESHTASVTAEAARNSPALFNSAENTEALENELLKASIGNAILLQGDILHFEGGARRNSPGRKEMEELRATDRSPTILINSEQIDEDNGRYIVEFDNGRGEKYPNTKIEVLPAGNAESYFAEIQKQIVNGMSLRGDSWKEDSLKEKGYVDGIGMVFINTAVGAIPYGVGPAFSFLMGLDGLNRGNKQAAEIDVNIAIFNENRKLEDVADVLAMEASMAKSEDGKNAKVVIYFNDAELQRRVDRYNKAQKEKNPEHQDITIEQLKAELGKSEPALLDHYLSWQKKNALRDIG